MIRPNGKLLHDNFFSKRGNSSANSTALLLTNLVILFGDCPHSFLKIKVCFFSQPQFVTAVGKNQHQAQKVFIALVNGNIINRFPKCFDTLFVLAASLRCSGHPNIGFFKFRQYVVFQQTMTHCI
ncbi:Uncharacterised protein [Vibrio cholerae]|uniref:Uncharacterized protein n=1 Tax=Vibrio cholerae TaxID=666 RepID=A0A655SBS1_VIBCL|nr:Uncharacterised protein [Vibrio cholerae]CSC83147.1 Uncharacterised protein [Vibrio cholerae]CSD31961.1 Uncharacterised protein [Vibrio cholerae]